MVTKTIVRQMCGETGLPLPDLNDVNNPFLALFRQIDSMRKKNLLCDVTLLFDDGRRLCAHKIVLAASSRYLKSRFTAAPGSAVRIQDVSSSVGSLLVDYAYTLQIRLAKENIDEVQTAAQKLGFLDLDEECRKRRKTKSFQQPKPEKKRKSKKKTVLTAKSPNEKSANSEADDSTFAALIQQTSGKRETDHDRVDFEIKTDTVEPEGMTVVTSQSVHRGLDESTLPSVICGPFSLTSTPDLAAAPSVGPMVDSFSTTPLIIETSASSALQSSPIISSADVFPNFPSSAIDLSVNSAITIADASTANVMTSMEDHSPGTIIAEGQVIDPSSTTILAEGDGIPIVLSADSASTLIGLNIAEIPAEIPAEKETGSTAEANSNNDIRSDDPIAIATWRKSPSKKKRVQCSYCLKSIYGSFYTFMTHVSEVHGEKTNACPYCEKKFTRKSYLRLHVDSYHNGKNSEDMQCQLCSKQFLTKHTLRKHMRDIHENTQPYCCPHCPKAYRQESSLRDHVQLVHLSAPKFLCPDCDKGFMSLKDRDNHRDFVHLGKKAPKLACPECDKVFTEAHLRKHIAAVHKGLKMKCDDCELEFSSRAVLVRHKEVVHAKRRFRCTLCLAEYRDFNAWRKHHQSQHIGMRFPCGHCTRSFKSRNAMTRHVESAHRGLRFACQICSKTFAQKSMLSTHTKVAHMGHVPHPCTLCDSGFSRPALLKDHMLKEHRVVVDDGQSRADGGERGKTVDVVVADDQAVGSVVVEGSSLVEYQNGFGGREGDGNDGALDSNSILTTVSESDILRKSSFDQGFGAPTYVITTAAPDGTPLPDGAHIIATDGTTLPDGAHIIAPDGTTLPDGAHIIEPSNILYASDISSGNGMGEGEMTLIYNGEVVTASNVGSFDGPVYEFV